MKPLLIALPLALAWLVTPARAQNANDTFSDPFARELLARARARRATHDAAITEYSALSRERISLGYRLLARDRLLYRRETAARIHWRRGGTTEIRVLGARDVAPVASGATQVPADLPDFMPHIAFDPLDAGFLFRPDTSVLRHPLAADAERNYRFATGDSAALAFPDGHTIRLRELRFTPRRADHRLIAGSFWFEHESFAVVQAVFRLSRAQSLSETADPKDRPPFFLPEMKVDFTRIVVEYSLWDFRWWMPRQLSLEGVFDAGPLGSMPIQWRLSYDDYEVKGDTARAATLPPDTTWKGCRRRMAFGISVGTGQDTATARLRRELERRAAAAPKDSTDARCAKQYVVTLPDSITDLRRSDYFEGSIYGDDTGISEAELAELGERVRDLPLAPWQLGRARTEWGLGGRGLLRYNRVEGLGLGARAQLDLGRGTLGLEGSYGFADAQPKGTISLGLERSSRQWRLSAYRSLQAADPAMQPFSLGNSLSAFLFGRDDAQYFRALGTALEVAPVTAQAQTYALRLYAERQAAAGHNTDFSLPHLFSADHTLGPNITADPATQYGADLTLRADFGANPNRLRAGARFDLRAQTGSYDFVRPALTLRTMLPPLLGLTLATEAAAGTTLHDSPVQSRWYLGGTPTLRGYSNGIIAGAAFWRTRAELATALPLVRLTLFSDAGWAGSTEGDAWKRERPLLSAGAGISLLDGVLRFDVARALRDPKDWRVHLYLGGLL